MNIILYVRWTDHPCFTGDVRIIHDLQLTYRTFMSYGRHTECSCVTVDIQVTLPHGRWSEHQKLTKHRQQLPKCNWN